MTKKFFGLKYKIGIEHLHYCFLSDEEMIYEPQFQSGLVGPAWDIGCCFGLWSIFMAKRNHQVTAFDLSPRACNLTQKSAALNNLYVTTVPKPLTIDVQHYRKPLLAYQEKMMGVIYKS